MSAGTITADDVADWGSLDDIATSLEKRGLIPRPELERDGGYENELLVELDENRYLALIEANAGEDPSTFNRRQNRRVATNLVATQDFKSFSFISMERSLDAHGRITRKQFTFEKERIEEGDRYTVLDKLNEIEYGNPRSIEALYDTRRVVDEFYEEFEGIRTDLVSEVVGIPDDRGDAKRRYVQVTLNRLIFLYFIQEKGLLDFNEEYLLENHLERESENKDTFDTFYRPLFFKALAEETPKPEFGHVPYLNGGLFSTSPVEEEFPDAKLGVSVEETNALFREILEFLGSWNWNVDERLDVIEPKNLSPAVLGHIFEQTVNQKEMGAYYTPEEITHFMARRSIQPRVLDELNEKVDAEYQELDEIFGLRDEGMSTDQGPVVAADGGTLTQQASLDAADREHVEALYFDVLKDLHVLDPAVGSGAFLLASEDVLLDIYIHSIEYFEELEQERPFAVTGRVSDELDRIRSSGSKTLYAKREIILNNLYGVDIDEGAVGPCLDAHRQVAQAL